MIDTLRILPPAVVLAAVLAGCSSGGEGGDAVEAATPAEEPPRAPSRTEAAVIDASVGFGLELVARTVAADPRANIVLSPLSASMALGMALNGADGALFDAMRETLGFGTLSRDELNAAYRELLDSLAGLDPDVRLEIANAVWADDDVPFHDAFLQAVTAAFDARAESSDFADPATVAAINEWVEQQTEGRIDGIVDTLDPSLVMLLLNAVYFDGAWTTSFDAEQTRREAFQREDGSSVDVEMMSLRNVEVLRANGDSYSAVELPYGAGAFAMLVVVPHPGVGAREWLAGLDADRWADVVEGLETSRLDLLSMPKFTLTFDAYLNDALIAMGMEPAFVPGADFTRLSPLGQQMCIDFVRQKARIEVDEQGTRAAAATSVGIGLVSFNGFVVDRPFVFAIRERRSGAILFVGLVGDPTAENEEPPPLVSGCTGAVLSADSSR